MHPLEKRLAAIRGRVHRLLTLHGASWTLAIVFSAALALCLADYFIRFEDRGVRLIATLALLLAAGWAAWRFLRPALSAKYRDLDIALRIERRFPGLNDRLASTVQFLHESEQAPEAGSAALRKAVVMETNAEVERLDLSSVVDSRIVRRGAVAVAAAALAVVVLLALDPSSGRIAALRLAWPLGGPQWPKRNHLRIENPVTRLAVGDTFEIAVSDDRGSKYLPEFVQLHIRHTGESSAAAEEVVRLDFLDGQFVYSRAGVRRPFTYRATGGDDQSMAPVQLEVVEPPALESLTLTIEPPAYTGWPQETSLDKMLRALQGSRVAVSGQTTKRLASAKVQVDDGPPLAADIAEDGYSFSLPIRNTEGDFIVAQPGVYRILLEDAEMPGVVGGKETRYEIRAVADVPPAVTIEQPAANGYVTADADVPVRVAVKDDLAIRDISLVYLRSDQSETGPATLELFRGPDAVAPRGEEDEATGDTRTVEHVWSLASLKLPVGAQLTFHAAAGDYRPQTGQSQPVRLTIVSREDLENRVAERQSFILGELSRVLKLERDSRSQVAGLEIQLKDVGELTKNDLDRLQGAEMTQRQVERSLTSATEGLPAHIEGLLADLKNNKLDSPDTERRMESLLDEIDRLNRDHLPPINQSLTGAIKGAQAGQPSGGKKPQKQEGENPREQNEPGDDEGRKPVLNAEDDKPEGGKPEGDKPEEQTPGSTPPEDEGKKGEQPKSNPAADSPVGKALTEAGKHQDEVVESLEKALGELSQGEAFARLFREVGQLRHDQESVGRDTAETAKETLAKDFKDLTQQQQADLKKLGQQQQELARRFDKLQERMGQVAPQLEKDDPLAADAVKDAIAQAQEQALAGQMQQAGRNVEQNQLGQAQQQQQDIAGNLQEMLDTLSNRREQELSRLVKKLQEAERQLQELRDKQAALKKKLAKAAEEQDPEEREKQLERLTREQKKLQEEAERLARRLERLQADQAGKSLAKAGQKMSSAGEQGEQGDAAGAEEAVEQAEKDLDDAAQELAEARKQAEQDLAVEQLAKIADALNSLHDRQKAAIDDLHRLADLQESQAKLTRAQLISLQDLSRLEKSLEEEVLTLAKKLAAAEVFSLALKGAARELDRTAGLLAEREVGPPAQAAAENARRRLARLLEALKNDPQKGEKQEQQEGQENGGDGNSGQQGDGIPNIAQLKLLKLMQEEINDRTAALEEAHGPDQPLTDEQKQEYLDLSAEQGQLAELVLNLSQPSEEEGEEDGMPEGDEEGMEDMQIEQPEERNDSESDTPDQNPFE